MESYAEVRQEDRSNAEIMGKKRQDKSLREFKQVLKDLVYLLRKSSEVETCYLYWVNRSREQFVMETKSTELSNVMFQDRVSFYDHFLNQYRDISEPVSLKLNEQIDPEELLHYYNQVPIKHITLLPFINNGQTVAITVLESSEYVLDEEKSEVIHSYSDALRNVLNTYLEISDLYENQEEWVDYQESLEKINVRSHRAELIYRMINEMQKYLQSGGVSFITQGMQNWSNVLNSVGAQGAPPIGMPVKERTLAYEALHKGKPEFAIHFNNNPKRISPREQNTDGATMAIPLKFHDRRQGLVLLYDKNPLLFKESTKHKFVNFVRLTELTIMANEPNLDHSEPFLNNEFDAIIPDLWERLVDTELQTLGQNGSPYNTWFGLVTMANLPALRTQLRMEDLDHMQKDLVNLFNPNKYGKSGFIGSHSDYVYSFVIQDREENAVDQWIQLLNQRLMRPVELTNGVQIETSIKVGFTQLNAQQEDNYEVLRQAKAALSETMKDTAE
ncbi:GAF domain-containing protein [Aliifodinibius sp. S!AR15-10]|uniref:GAF domain-containing protein n=1 Tax=Aliifodinibius sp. S!AR15-10 TaxID=2950437 RepID=UPI002864B98E|nr:GAF domain-containing protein [Aliifodinibius sp. S!AR15-10]MDR8390546.1 GAF domain-containing protein [Aliifodinibius sp. S!AR15-10]